MTSLDTPVIASTPFDAGDVVIRSCDNQDLLMYKVDLSRASPVFKTMFTLPQPTTASPEVETQGGLPVVVLSEPASVLNILFALCKPTLGSTPHLGELTDVAHLLEAAKKYEMEWIVDLARERMRELAGTDAIRAYAVACRFGLKEEASFAARCCLQLPMKTILACKTEELDFVSAVQFRNLLNYRDDCQKAVEAYLRSDKVYAYCRSSENLGCPSMYYHGQRGREWQKRYVDMLSLVLQDCVWEGAVRLEDILLAQMELPNEICAKCPNRGRYINILREQIASDIARAIPKLQFDDAWDVVAADFAHIRPQGREKNQIGSVNAERPGVQLTGTVYMIIFTLAIFWFFT